MKITDSIKSNDITEINNFIGALIRLRKQAIITATEGREIELPN